jgi:hypothetical protein
MRKLGFKLLLLFILVASGYTLVAGNAFAATPTLDYFAPLIPKPVKTFYESVQKTDFAFQDAFHDLPKNGTEAVNFLKTAGAFLVTLLKGAGSVFTWVFNALANGLERLITTP